MGDFFRPITHIENGIKRFLYINMPYPLIFVEQFFQFWGWKRPQNLTFLKKIQTQNIFFWIFSKSSLRNEHFLPYFDTQHILNSVVVIIYVIVS